MFDEGWVAIQSQCTQRDTKLSSFALSARNKNTAIIHCLHDFAHKQDSQLNSSVLITVWRFVIENNVTELPTK